MAVNMSQHSVSGSPLYAGRSGQYTQGVSWGQDRRGWVGDLQLEKKNSNGDWEVKVPNSIGNGTDSYDANGNVYNNKGESDYGKITFHTDGNNKFLKLDLSSSIPEGDYRLKAFLFSGFSLGHRVNGDEYFYYFSVVHEYKFVVIYDQGHGVGEIYRDEYSSSENGVVSFSVGAPNPDLPNNNVYFSHWVLDAGRSTTTTDESSGLYGANYNENITLKSAGTIYLVASYLTKDKVCAITYDIGAARWPGSNPSGSIGQLKPGDKVELTVTDAVPVPTDSLNVFLGWYNGDTKYEAGQRVTLTAPFTLALTARYARKDQNCRVEYNIGGSARWPIGDPSENVVCLNGETVEFTVTSQTPIHNDSDKMFGGWYSGGNRYLEGSRIALTAPSILILEARYLPKDAYTDSYGVTTLRHYLQVDDSIPRDAYEVTLEGTSLGYSGASEDGKPVTLQSSRIIYLQRSTATLRSKLSDEGRVNLAYGAHGGVYPGGAGAQGPVANPAGLDAYVNSIREAAEAARGRRRGNSIVRGRYETALFNINSAVKDNTGSDLDDFDTGSAPVSLLERYTVTGGPEEPFERLTLRVNRKALIRAYPEFDDDGSDGTYSIVEGVSSIRINGTREYIVASQSYSADTLTVTAYCRANRLCGATLLEAQSGVDPLGLIIRILCESSYGVTYDRSDIVALVEGRSDESDVWGNVMYPAGSNVWEVLQACAVLLRCRIFFTADKVFLIDYTRLDSYDAGYWNGTVELNRKEITDDVQDSENPSDRLENLTRYVTGEVDTGDEGLSTVANRMRLTYGWRVVNNTGGNSEISYESRTVPVSPDDLELASSGYYGVSETSVSIGPAIPVSEFNSDRWEEVWSNAYRDRLRYRVSPQTSVGFTVNEAWIKDGRTIWLPVFKEVCAVHALHSEEDGLFVSNDNELKVASDSPDHRPEKLILSTYSRTYPEMRTEYWFGRAATVSLAQSTSDIRSRLR